MIDIRGNQMDRTIGHLKGISESFDLTIEDRAAISTAIETIRERNKTVYIVTLLEALSKEGYCTQIFDLVSLSPSKIIYRQQGGVLITYPAYSTDELLEVIPSGINLEDIFLVIKGDEDYHVEMYDLGLNKSMSRRFSDKSLPEALAKMCLWLFENGYIYDQDKKVMRRKD